MCYAEYDRGIILIEIPPFSLTSPATGAVLKDFLFSLLYARTYVILANFVDHAAIVIKL